MGAQNLGAQHEYERVERCPRQIEVGARLAVFGALAPPGGADGDQRVEDGGSQGTSVDEGTSDVVAISGCSAMMRVTLLPTSAIANPKWVPTWMRSPAPTHGRRQP